MEGGGSTRLGSRSSTRHGPAAVFSGPVRRWKKTWAHIASSNPSPVASRVLLYKWIPIPPPSSAGGKDENPEESNARPVRYLPVSVVLAQKKEAARKAAEEAEAETAGAAAAPVKLATQNDMNVDGDSEVQIITPGSTNSTDIQGSAPVVEDINRAQKLGTEDAHAHDSLEKSQHVPSEDRHGGVELKSADIDMQDQEPEEDIPDDCLPKLSGADAEMDSQSGAGNVRDGEG